MTRPYRFLSDANSSSAAVAEPPQAVTVESDFVVILAALLCALICVVGLIAVARCAWLRRGAGPGAGRRAPGQPSANKGLKKKFLESLPKYTYDSSSSSSAVSKDGSGKLSSGDCAICLAEYANGDEIRVLPQCGHCFHVTCIDTWLGSHSSCPSCRQILVITRCRKCGEFPSVSPVAGGTPSSETELKGRQETSSSSTSSTYLP